MKYLILLTLLFGCSTTKPMEPVSPEPMPPLSKCAEKTWCWDQLVLNHITENMLKADMADFCPNAAKLDRKKVYIQFAKAVSFAESGWNPSEDFLESTMGIDPITGKQIVSSGLFQLSWQDRKNYPNAPTCQKLDYKANPKAIYSPEINIGCAMEIMDTLLAKHGPNVVTSLGKYWSSVREPVQVKDKNGKLVWKHAAARNKLKLLLPECS